MCVCIYKTETIAIEWTNTKKEEEEWAMLQSIILSNTFNAKFHICDSRNCNWTIIIIRLEIESSERQREQSPGDGLGIGMRCDVANKYIGH